MREGEREKVREKERERENHIVNLGIVLVKNSNKKKN